MGNIFAFDKLYDTRGTMISTSTLSNELTAEKRAKVSKVATNLLSGFKSPITSYLKQGRVPVSKIKTIVYDHIAGQLNSVFKGENLNEALAELKAAVATYVDTMVQERETAEAKRQSPK